MAYVLKQQCMMAFVFEADQGFWCSFFFPPLKFLFFLEREKTVTLNFDNFAAMLNMLYTCTYRYLSLMFDENKSEGRLLNLLKPRSL